MGVGGGGSGTVMAAHDRVLAWMHGWRMTTMQENKAPSIGIVQVYFAAVCVCY